MRDIFRGVLTLALENEKDEERADGGSEGVEVLGWSVICDFFGEVGGVSFGDRVKNPFFGMGGAVSICKSVFLIALDTEAEKDLDRGRAARKPGLGPAVDGSSIVGEVTLR